MTAALARSALNHMTTPKLGYAALIDLARAFGCAGVEPRNDLADHKLFNGDAGHPGLPPAS